MYYQFCHNLDSQVIYHIYKKHCFYFQNTTDPGLFNCELNAKSYNSVPTDDIVASTDWSIYYEDVSDCFYFDDLYT